MVVFPIFPRYKKINKINFIEIIEKGIHLFKDNIISLQEWKNQIKILDSQQVINFWILPTLFVTFAKLMDMDFLFYNVLVLCVWNFGILDDIVMTFLVRECYGSPKKQEF
jgi:hypothetical protein